MNKEKEFKLDQRYEIENRLIDTDGIDNIEVEINYKPIDITSKEYQLVLLQAMFIDGVYKEAYKL